MSRDRDRSKETTRPVRLPEKLITAAEKATGLPAGPAVREMVRRGLAAKQEEAPCSPA